MKKNLRYVAIPLMSLLTAAALAGCTTTPRETATDDAPDPRRGEKVDRICFANGIDGWNSNGRDSVIVSKGVNEKYELTLNGTCDIERAFETIGIDPTLPCLTRGDKIHTDARISGPCYIKEIYRWNPDAKDEATEDDASAEKSGS